MTTLPERRPLALLPVGSYEQHGPHLPFTTDTQIAVAVCEQAAHASREQGIDVELLPPLHVSASDEHLGFRGTLSIGTIVTADVLTSIARSSTWTRGIIIVNGHGGNADAITLARERLTHEAVTHAFWNVAGYADNDSHAGHAETSLMLHIAPGDVAMHRAEPGNIESLANLMPRMREAGVRAVSANGVLGDPRRATAEEGARLLTRNVEALTTLIVELDRAWTR